MPGTGVQIGWNAHQHRGEHVENTHGEPGSNEEVPVRAGKALNGELRRPHRLKQCAHAPCRVRLLEAQRMPDGKEEEQASSDPVKHRWPHGCLQTLARRVPQYRAVTRERAEPTVPSGRSAGRPRSECEPPALNGRDEYMVGPPAEHADWRITRNDRAAERVREQ